ncbi:hypothetical protein FACS1894178_7150 [Bacteroidia bacterium]|nr:hypothetical protein FACS1894178_7150 [Bacteroidia bacterium]
MRIITKFYVNLSYRFEIMKKLTVAILLLLLGSTAVFAQRNELGFGGGTSFYLGDINPKGVFYEPQWSAGLHYRYNFTTRWAMRFNLNYGRIHGDDANHNNPRNLDFRNDIYEFSGVAELNFLTFFTGSKKMYRCSPYLFAGLGVFFHNPQGSYTPVAGGDKEWVYLRPLSTEGQGLVEYPERKYSSAAQLCLPFGIGFKYSLSKHWSIELEWGMRLTFTDYLDDVSTTYVNSDLLTANRGDLAALMSNKTGGTVIPGSERGNSSTKDWYSFAMLKLSYKIIPSKLANCPAYSQSKKTYRKPVWE